MKKAYVLTVIIMFLGCLPQKRNNLKVFVDTNEAIFKKELAENFSKDKNSNLVDFNKTGFTVAFWMHSRNYSENGVLFSLNLSNTDELRESLLTIMVSKQRLSVLARRKDFRKKNYYFKNDFSKRFLELPTLDLNEKYFVSCTYSSITKVLTIYTDGEKYLEEKINIDFKGDMTLRIGYTVDNLVNKYFLKGELRQFYIFSKILEKEDIILLMNLTLIQNYPLN
ncbi:LamG-like jellyroll fold domain-containing protein [uncultured Allomuricauda sp.]|uniref:LamG-like jellyroll fold domain-containing protein n=1 Tax=Flagellimonas sp. W118 TaxID=3410791 RepID=UPI00262CE642|nr:LamG-like jellyroll fold domain-containing protein [uncultured Allomuricauda sp.]